MLPWALSTRTQSPWKSHLAVPSRMLFPSGISAKESSGNASLDFSDGCSACYSSSKNTCSESERARGLRLANSVAEQESLSSIISSLNAIKDCSGGQRGAWGELMAPGQYGEGRGTLLQQEASPSFHFSFTSSKPKCVF